MRLIMGQIAQQPRSMTAGMKLDADFSSSSKIDTCLGGSPLPLGEGAAKRRVRVPTSSEYTLIRRFAPPSPRGRRTRPSFGSDLGHLWSQTAVTAAADHLSKRGTKYRSLDR